MSMTEERTCSTHRTKAWSLVALVGPLMLVAGLAVGFMIGVQSMDADVADTTQAFRAGASPAQVGVDVACAVSSSRPTLCAEPAPSTIPPLLSEQQIQSLTVDEAREALSRVARTRTVVRDPELQAQLKTQFKLLMDRVRERNRSGSAPAPPDSAGLDGLPSLDDAEIAALTPGEARNRLRLVAQARAAAPDDPQLRAQFQLLIARVRDGP